MPEAGASAGRLQGLPAQLFAFRFPYWKRPVVRQCFPGHRVRFAERADEIPGDCCLALWGLAPVPEGLPAGVRVLRLEDGFLRSVGLGVDLVRPVSWVIDGTGMYCDSGRPSDLEEILAHGDFGEALLARAARLRARVVEAGITKYNVGAQSWQRPRDGRRVVLVPGQVETDASLAYGAPGLRTNLGLLQAARSACPDAHLVYKPHPDVSARLRAIGQGEGEARRWCDEIVDGVDMGGLLLSVDEVHVITSLAGFEALLRGKPVTCHGQPFYSGWGLTRDVLPVPRRGRALTLDALVAGALIEYPVYLSRDGRRRIDPEQALDELHEWRERRGGSEPWWRGIARVFLRRINGVR